MKQSNNENRKINKDKVKQNAQKRKPKSSILSKIIMVVALAVFIYSAYQLYSIYAEYKVGSKEYADIVDLVVTKNKNEEQNARFQVDFATLKGINPDTVGWIRFDEPSIISYPVVQGKDNVQYLTKTFKANDNKLGTIFVDVNNSPDFIDLNTIIYGHNMKDGSMFAKLLEYKSQEFYKKNPYFYIYAPDGREIKYQIVAASIIQDVSPLYQLQFNSSGEWQAYIDLMKSSSLYDTGVTVSPDNTVVTLSTCTNVTDEERFVVQGIKVGEE